MKHDRAQLLLSDFLEGNLPPEDQNELQAHLKQCATCESDLDLLRRALNLVHQVPRVEAPSDFSQRLKNRARKAGLFKARMRKNAMRVLVPFEAVMAVLLAAMGAMVIYLLVVYSELQTYEVDRPPVVLLVESTQEMNQLAQACWRLDGSVYAMGRKVPWGSPLGASPELKLVLDPSGWPAFTDGLGAGSRADVQREPAPINRDGLIQVIVQLFRERKPEASEDSSP